MKRNKYMVRRLANEFMCMEKSLRVNDLILLAIIQPCLLSATNGTLDENVHFTHIAVFNIINRCSISCAIADTKNTTKMFSRFSTDAMINA